MLRSGVPAGNDLRFSFCRKFSNRSLADLPTSLMRLTRIVLSTRVSNAVEGFFNGKTGTIERNREHCMTEYGHAVLIG